MNSEIRRAYEKERVRLKAATGKFLEVKEPVACFHMVFQHVLGVRAEMNTLIECLSNPGRKIDEEQYYKILIKNLMEQTSILCAAMPGIIVDDNGRVHGNTLSRPN